MQSKLLPYVLPLIIVYWAEYAIQSGAWTVFAIGGPITDKTARTRSYQILNLFYQIGVLISRSAGKLFTLSLRLLWLGAWAQVVMLILFAADGFTLLWVGPTLAIPALFVGLLGGTNYIQILMAIDRRLPKRLRELALATVSVGAPVGILAADASGLLLQQCLFRFHDLPAVSGHRADEWCPLVPLVNRTRM